jgi:membrane protein YdbS with pleckstrin-like domain
MQLQPAAFLYIAVHRMAAALIIGLMIGVFTSSWVPLHHVQHGQPTPQVDAHAGVQSNGTARTTQSPAAAQIPQQRAYVNWPAFITMGVFTAISFPAVLLYAWFLAKSYRIELRQDGLSLHYGIVTTTNELMSYGKIQDIVISQGILGRLLSLVTIKIQNAMGKPQIIPGCSLADAEMLRDTAIARGSAA